MPALRTIALLCQYLYKQQNLLQDWKIINQQSGNDSLSEGSGYFGQAFLNEKTKEIIVVHRGTKLYSFDEKFNQNINNDKPNAATCYSNLYNDSVLAAQYIPPEIMPALILGYKIKQSYPDYRILQAGHSLGAFVANIVGYFCQQEVVGFDGPGCKQQLEKITQGRVCPNQLKTHYNLLAQKDLVNQTNSQVGNIYYRKPMNNDWRPLNNQSVCEQIETTLDNHGISTFINSIPESAPDPRYGIPDNFVTPEYYQAKGKEQERNLKSETENDTSNKKNISTVSMVNNRYNFSKENWLVTLVNTKGIFDGHAVITVEGLDENGSIFQGEYDITAHSDGGEGFIQSLFGNVQGYITKIRCSNDFHRFYLDISDNSKKSWYVKPEAALKMITSITTKSQLIESAIAKAAEKKCIVDWPFKYQRAGSARLSIFGTNSGENCISFAEKELAVAGVGNGALKSDYIKAIPQKHVK